MLLVPTWPVSWEWRAGWAWSHSYYIHEWQSCSNQENQIVKLQRVQNAAAWILSKSSKFTHITPILKQLNPKKTGGGGLGPPPLDISRDYSATRKALAATLYDFFLSSFPHILTPNLWCPGVWFWSYLTFCTCTSDRKWLQNVILCTKSMQIEFFHIVHINMLIFTLNGWNEFVLALLAAGGTLRRGI